MRGLYGINLVSIQAKDAFVTGFDRRTMVTKRGRKIKKTSEARGLRGLFWGGRLWGEGLAAAWVRCATQGRDAQVRTPDDQRGCPEWGKGTSDPMMK
jgi:hypothetical protein